MKTKSSPRSLLFVALVALALAGCGKSPEEQLQEGKALLDKADYKGAIIALKSAVQAQPQNRDARFLLGKAYLVSEAYADAEKELSKARELGMGDEQVLPGIAKSLLKQGQFEKVLGLSVAGGANLSPQSTAAFQAARAQALLALNRRAEADQAILAASQADAQHPELLLLMGQIALMDRKPSEAMNLVDSALQKDTKFSDALYIKAAMLQQDRKPDEAIAVYQRILANDGKQFRAHLAIAQIHLQAGKIVEAEKALQAAESIAGGVPMVRYARGMFELRRGKLKEANEAFLQVLKAIPDHLPTLLAQGIASYGLGNYEQSLKNAQRVVAGVPGNPMANRLLAASKLKTGDPKGAWITLEPLLQPDTKDPQLFHMASEIQMQLGDTNKSLEYLGRASALDPDNPELMAQQGMSRLQLGQDSRGLADLEKAARLSAKPGKADFALILYHMKRAQFDAALNAIAILDKKQPGQPATHNLRAAALLGKKDKAGARAELEKALAIQPGFFPAAMGLARLDLADKNTTAARKRFESILAKEPTNLQAMLALSELARVEKKEEEYVQWLEKAVKSHPEAIQPTEQLIRYHLAKKNKDKALELARQVVKAYPNSSQALALLGSVQSAAGSKSDAISSFTTLVEKNKDSPEAHLRLALAQLGDNQTDAARHSLARALQIKADYLAAQDALIRLEISAKQPEAALRIARQMQQQHPKSPIGHEREGDIHFSQKSYSLAAKAYERALDLGHSLDIFVKRHWMLTYAGDGKGAEKRLLERLQATPKDVGLRTFAAQIYMMEKRNRDAIVQYEALLKTAPDHVLALNNLASLYHKEKDPRALATAEQALKLAPTNPSVMDTVGWILVDQGPLPRAIDLLRKAAEAAPKVGAIRYHLAVALSKQGDKSGARKELEAAIASGDKFPELDAAKALLKTL